MLLSHSFAIRRTSIFYSLHWRDYYDIGRVGMRYLVTSIHNLLHYTVRIVMCVLYCAMCKTHTIHKCVHILWYALLHFYCIYRSNERSNGRLKKGISDSTTRIRWKRSCNNLCQLCVNGRASRGGKNKTHGNIDLFFEDVWLIYSPLFPLSRCLNYGGIWFTLQWRMRIVERMGL